MIVFSGFFFIFFCLNQHQQYLCAFQEELHANKQVRVTFRFRNRCEYVIEGSRLIFRSGQQTKGSGQVIKVLPILVQ
jgi:GTPase